ncbi:hypothetical protein GCM10008018_50920 [Paenibacillus marchantiophytorum]|uniref:Uncharacterized protein n=1 Tax=Paenibacillus marchantiophytorum TaxID=1619310 RepID=A0ABQ1F3W1_9BACL|nr:MULTISPECIES: hypothetical protein [Paenibacillus]UKS24716.1 hypothetical protein LOZ80_24300 [Paenibacillus sp. HWE-109]GFZ98537.1 hypothetical protein GCM10008018_50920 [Paenibacillus marchantiophytorum]
MSLQHKAYGWIGSPVGVSLKDGTGTSGILCSIQGGSIYVIEYLYHTQFATKHYRFEQIQDILPFPQCPKPTLYQTQPLY